MSSEIAIDAKSRLNIIIATLLVLFLGALDALVMSAAMPTIVSDLGGLHLYSWVYSAYLLARAVSLPLFGKLADRYTGKALFNTAIGSFYAGMNEAQAVPLLMTEKAVYLQAISTGAVFLGAWSYVGDDPHFEHVTDAPEEEMASKAVVDEIVTLDLLEQGLLDECDIAFFAMRKTLQDGRRIV